MDFTILHFAIHIVWRANVICTCRKSGIARKTTVAYPELRFIGELSVILLRLKELVVEVKVVFLALYELARRYQYVKQQVVELVGRVEVILLARLGSVRRVLLFQFVHDTEYGVRTA